MIYYLKQIAEQYGKSENIIGGRIAKLKETGKFKKSEPGYGFNEKDIAALEKLLGFKFDRQRAAGGKNNSDNSAA